MPRRVRQTRVQSGPGSSQRQPYHPHEAFQKPTRSAHVLQPVHQLFLRWLPFPEHPHGRCDVHELRFLRLLVHQLRRLPYQVRQLHFPRYVFPGRHMGERQIQRLQNVRSTLPSIARFHSPAGCTARLRFLLHVETCRCNLRRRRVLRHRFPGVLPDRCGLARCRSGERGHAYRVPRRYREHARMQAQPAEPDAVPAC